jgi:plasmid stabilization system protein ParE
MAGYRQTACAAQDFEDLFVHGALSFGLERAESYAAGMEARLDQLVEQPQL